MPPRANSHGNTNGNARPAPPVPNASSPPTPAGALSSRIACTVTAACESLNSAS